MIPTSKIAFNIWTHEGDGDKVVFCVSAIRKFQKNSPIFIWDDANKSIGPEIKDELKNLGCEVRETFFKRDGGLRGEYCHDCMVGNFLEGSVGCDYVAKIDPDTLFVSGNLDSFLEGKNYICQASGGGLNGVYGFYCFRRELLHLMKKTPKSTIKDFASQKGISPAPLFEIDDFSFAVCAMFFYQTGVSFLSRGVFWKTGLGFNKPSFLNRKKEIVLYDFGTNASLKRDNQRIIENMRDGLGLS